MVETLTNVEKEWAEAKSKLKVGTIVKGEVLAHWPFGIFVSLKVPFVGLVEIIRFKDKDERMTAKQYPALGEPIRAVVLGYRERNHQIELSARPSDLAKVKVGK